MPDIVKIIEKKRDGLELSEEQITEVVNGFSKGSIPDYQMSAFLMAVVCRGMALAETVALTKAMWLSGETLDLSSIPGIKIDKHSTGGVGDKVSLALVPIVAAAGVPIAKMSGRGLGHTGGTLDKLESIAGFYIELSAVQIVRQLSEIGGCICAQTDRIAPADKKMYALRDVTGTVESIPLIAASIMSKKLAGGADVILTDVKVGRGAFMKTVDDARKLAQTMHSIGAAFGKTVVGELTTMDVPLGQAVGNLIELYEVVNLLRGRPVDTRLKDLVIGLSDRVLQLAKSDKSAAEIIAGGSALAKFEQIVAAQGGDIRTIDRWANIRPISTVPAPRSGYITDIDALTIGRSTMDLGAGRREKDDFVNPLAGIWIDALLGSKVEAGQPLARMYGKPQKSLEDIERLVGGAFAIDDSAREIPTTIIESVPKEMPN
jgi:pyrimidine-nucleoside phosphorylase